MILQFYGVLPFYLPKKTIVWCLCCISYPKEHFQPGQFWPMREASERPLGTRGSRGGDPDWISPLRLRICPQLQQSVPKSEHKAPRPGSHRQGSQSAPWSLPHTATSGFYCCSKICSNSPPSPSLEQQIHLLMHLDQDEGGLRGN